jgi:RNA polymerase sigma factor (sigma-70 family)
MDINSLYNQARSGDEEAAEQLFEKLTARFRFFATQSVGTASDAEELVQDALLVILRKYRQIEIQTSFVAWAQAVLEREILAYHRKKNTRARRFHEFIQQTDATAAENSDPIFQRVLLKCLDQVAKRSRNYARILNLHYQGYTTGEVSQRVGVTKNHSYVLLSRARSLLEACLEKGGVS